MFQEERKGSVQYHREVKQEVRVKGSTGLGKEEVFDGGKSLTGEHQKSELWGKASLWTPILQMMGFF